ncbi:PREDICTED: myosin-11-like isoform X2 [Lupinus angustifolius]|uniref:myosin-11-like isoform X2 n=1 Tax=Lupinus angustifolius TaxID=3871 RepID=UPI00092E5B75|nr:PREDICTED: myosin-11-like isoform X2 [Lupinus angustifolius]
MFRPWRTDKNKVKAVFKLHFHVTQMVQPGVEALVVSIIPGDTGKPSTRLEKTKVNDGVCRWENPVYESVKFVQDPKTGKFNERIYYFLVSTGLSKASNIGDVSIDIAKYVEATKPSSVSLPIKNSHCDVVLHVSIQRIQENNDKREEDECEDAKLKNNDRSLRTYLSNGDIDESTKSDSSEDISGKSNTNRAELSADCRTSSGSDITLSSSDVSSGLDTPRELEQRNTSIHPGTNGFLSDVSQTSMPQKPAVEASASMYDVQKKSHWDWLAGSEHGSSADDSTNGSQVALPKERSLEASDIEIKRLKAELSALARQVDMSDLELQTLRKQIVKESKRGQELSKEIIGLKDERDALKTECDNLRSLKKRNNEAKVSNRPQLESGDLRTLVEEIREELNYEKDLNANLRLQLKKTQESNAELVLAVQDLDDMLEQKNKEIYNLSNKHEQSKNSHELEGNLSKFETDDDEDQKELDELVKEHINAKETDLLEQKIIDLYGEIEMYRRDKDELEMQVEQIALDYEILKQEKHDIAYKLQQSQLQEQLKMQYECSSPSPDIDEFENHIEGLENQLKKQSEEFSTSLATIKALETQIRRLEEDLEKQARGFEADLDAVTRDKVEQEQRAIRAEKQSEEFSNSLATIKAHETQIRRLEEELEKQAQGFEADLDAVTRDKVEQEQRAIRAEEALRKTRQKNANTAERLQEEFRRLSKQMASTFDANEKATMRAMTEASGLRTQKRLLEQMLHKAKEELLSDKACYEVKLNELSNQIDMMTIQIQEMLSDIADKSKKLQNQKKHEEQLSMEISEEMKMIKGENERLKSEISWFSEQLKQKETLTTDLELMKKSVEESEILLQRGTVERNELVSVISSMKKEAEELLDELNWMRHLKNGKETVVNLLESELEELKAQHIDLKNSLFEDEAEKEKITKQVLQLKDELKQKDDALNNIEKRLKDSSGCTQLSYGSKTITKNEKTVSIPQRSKEMTLKDKFEVLEGQIKSKETALEMSSSSFLEKERELQCKTEELVNKVEEFNHSIALQKVVGVKNMSITENEDGIFTELSSLKERNKSMESELKEMQERYSEMSLKFAEVEGERQKLVMTVRTLKNARKVKN